MKKITPTNIANYIFGNLKMLGDQLNLLPNHQREQVIYRSQICSDCVSAGACKYCGCSVPGKLYNDESCNNGERFPSMMNATEWENFKASKNIVIRQ